MAKYRKLGRTSSQRKALLRNQVTALLYHGKIVLPSFLYFAMIGSFHIEWIFRPRASGLLTGILSVTIYENTSARFGLTGYAHSKLGNRCDLLMQIAP